LDVRDIEHIAHNVMQAIIDSFNQQLDRFLSVCSSVSGASISADEADVSGVTQQWEGLQTYFRSAVLPMTASEGELSSLAVSIVTELNRHMRLLALDMSFWQAAQQAATAHQKLDQIRTRLAQMRALGQGLGEQMH
jgi:hypothetical protein